MKLSELCSVQSGLTLRNGLGPPTVSGMLVVQPSDITDEGELAIGRSSRMANTDIRAHHLIQPGDVLFKSRGAHNSAWSSGEGIDEPAVALMPLFVLRPTSSALDANYLAWFINQLPAQQQLAQGATGTTVRTINKPVLMDLEVKLPPLRVQRKIAELAALDRIERNLVDRLANLRHQVISLRLNELSQNCSNELSRQA